VIDKKMIEDDLRAFGEKTSKKIEAMSYTFTVSAQCKVDGNFIPSLPVGQYQVIGDEVLRVARPMQGPQNDSPRV